MSETGSDHDSSEASIADVESDGEIADGDNDVAKTIQIFDEMALNASACTQLVENLTTKITDKVIPTKKGLNFFDLKNYMLFSYINNLSHLILLKANGKQIEGRETIQRLVEIRTVIEKMRPIQHKLKYQIDKLLTTATTGFVNAGDPMQFKPRIKNIVANPGQDGEDANDDEDESDDDVSEESGDEEATKKRVEKAKPNSKQIYKPPKLAAMHYDEEDEESKRKLQLGKLKKRAINSVIIQELRQEFDEGPEEFTEVSFMKKKENKMLKEREDYEEKYMVRLNMDKKEKRKSGNDMLTLSSLSSHITRFGDISALVKPSDSLPSLTKRKKISGKGSKKFSKKKQKRKIRK